MNNEFLSISSFPKNMSFKNTSRLSNSMDPDNAQRFKVNLPSAVDKVYQRINFSRQMFDAL